MTLLDGVEVRQKAEEVFGFWVPGKVVQQGSKTGFIMSGRVVITDQNAKELKPWRRLVAKLAGEAYDGEQLVAPTVVVMEFHLERPKSVKRAHPTVYPDIDKLVRAIFDGLTDSKTIKDDAQIVREYAEKVYSATPGVLVRVGVLTP